jgi:hypothetical protein
MINYGFSNATLPPNHVFTHGESEFDQNVLTIGNNFRTKYEHLEAYNGGQFIMVKNQECDNNIKRRLIFEGTTLLLLTKLFKLIVFNYTCKLSNVQLALKEVNL